MVNWLRNTVNAVTGTDRDDFVPDPKTATPDEVVNQIQSDFEKHFSDDKGNRRPLHHNIRLWRFPSHEVAVFQVPSVEKSEPSTSVVNQPFIFSAELYTADRTNLLAKYGIPQFSVSQSSAQTVAPNSSPPQQSTAEQSTPQRSPLFSIKALELQSMPAYKPITTKLSILSRPAKR